ncbi:MAG: hypothetical protein B6D64_05055 [Bacteroidetes bacterium 4484_276]|nr:MAG: hypothetical protein B6D64_05055 [Bacteroidetes bacterium 4484_276]
MIGCDKDKHSIPEYTPGRLLGVYNQTSIHPQYYEYEYMLDRIKIKRQKYNKNRVYDYKLRENNIEKIYFNREESTYNLSLDSVIYLYNNDTIIEYSHYRNEIIDSSTYVTNSGNVELIISNNPYSEDIIDSCIILWDNNNLIKYEVFQIANSQIIDTYSCSFQYTDIKNPFFRTNIPKVLKTGPYVLYTPDIAYFVPGCSRLFPSEIIWSNIGSHLLVYTIDINSYVNGKIYDIRVNIEIDNFSVYYDYRFEYEEF